MLFMHSSALGSFQYVKIIWIKGNFWLFFFLDIITLNYLKWLLAKDRKFENRKRSKNIRGHQINLRWILNINFWNWEKYQWNQS
jgi:hypothetical protein